MMIAESYAILLALVFTPLIDNSTGKPYCKGRTYAKSSVAKSHQKQCSAVLGKKKATMLETTANEFRKTLKDTVDTCIKNHQVLKIKRKNGANFVILGEEDWYAIEETLYLNRVPGLVESIHSSAAEPLTEGTPWHEIDW